MATWTFTVVPAFPGGAATTTWLVVRRQQRLLVRGLEGDVAAEGDGDDATEIPPCEHDDVAFRALARFWQRCP